jgi:hypothetical protein
VFALHGARGSAVVKMSTSNLKKRKKPRDKVRPARRVGNLAAIY